MLRRENANVSFFILLQLLSSFVSELGGAPPDPAVHLSQEQLTFLSFMRWARVTVDSMSVPACCASPPPEKTPNKSPSLLRRKKW